MCAAAFDWMCNQEAQLLQRCTMQDLAGLGLELVSTGGSAAAVAAAGIPVRKVEDLTGFPEMLDGAPTDVVMTPFCWSKPFPCVLPVAVISQLWVPSERARRAHHRHAAHHAVAC